MIINDTFVNHGIHNASVMDNGRLRETMNMSICLETTTPVYDHQGAMKFTVAVVLVYGIGVIGILGIYVRRKPSETLERDANVFVRGLGEYRERMEKKKQLSSVHNLIRSIHGEKWKYSPSSTAASTPMTTPVPDSRQARASFKNYDEDGRTVGSAGVIESVPLITGYRRPVLTRGLSSMERQDSIPETGEEEEGLSHEIPGTPGGEWSSIGFVRPTFTLGIPRPKRKMTECLSSKGVDLNSRGDNSSCDGSPSSESAKTEAMGIELTAVSSAKRTDDEENDSDLKTNGRFTVVNVQEV